MFYAYIKGTGESNAAALKAAEHIDLLTYNRIVDFDALTDAQKCVILRAHQALTQFETDNAEMLSSPLKSYSINGVSMAFGGDGLRNIAGVTVPSDVYSLIVSTGLCYLAI